MAILRFGGLPSDVSGSKEDGGCRDYRDRGVKRPEIPNHGTMTRLSQVRTGPEVSIPFTFSLAGLFIYRVDEWNPPFKWASDPIDRSLRLVFG
jgi:hypothetical protein